MFPLSYKNTDKESPVVIKLSLQGLLGSTWAFSEKNTTTYCFARFTVVSFRPCSTIYSLNEKM